ncbi:AAA family ATPase, partial [Pseudomonas savastanoi]|uniref:AAA family ATPase n=4 Tax=Pseudomonas savastanoi TaxID=29438 RepID=UPI000A3F0075
MLIVFSGLPGTGKTTIAKDLAATTGAVYLRIDAIEQAIRSSGALAQDVGRSGYMVANELALSNLCIGCEFHVIRTLSPPTSGHSFHAYPDRQSE